MTGIVAVGVEHAGDVMILSDVEPGLLHPCGVFAVVAIQELAMGDALTPPGTDVPWATGELLIAWIIEDEVFITCAKMEDDFEGFAIVKGILLKRDDVGVRSFTNGLQKARHVIGSDGVIVIDKGDVLATSAVEQGLTLEADAAVSVVIEHKVLDSGRIRDLRGDVLHELLALSDTFPACGGEDREERRGVHLEVVSSLKMASPSR
jgi:hypothetical protein